MHSILPSSPTSDRTSPLSRGLRPVRSALFRLIDVTLTLPHPISGLRYRMRMITHCRLWLFRSRQQRQTMSRLASLVRPTDVAIDVGGGIGCTAHALAQGVGGDGQVHVFEPCPLNQPLLQQNIRSFANTSMINAAVSDRVGKIMINSKARSTDNDPLQAHTVTLDGYALQHGISPAILRIGPSAQTVRVLQGGRKSLARARAALVHVDSDHEMVFGLLETAGFDLSDAFGAPLTEPAQMAGPVFCTR